MNRCVLINEIASFGIEYRIFDSSIGIDEIKIRLGYMLDEVEHIESLINTIIITAKTYKNVDIKKIKFILLGLETIRLDLEYGEENNSNKKSCLTKKK